MTEHLNQQQFEGYRQRQLQAAELLSVFDHLGECEACRRQVESDMFTDASFFATRSEVFDQEESTRGHLTENQLADHADHNLYGENLQLVSDHLAICERCTAAVNDLRAFRNEIAPTLERDYKPSTQTASVPGWWQRITATLPPLFQTSPTKAFASALAILLLLVGAWLGWRTQQNRTPKQEIAVAPGPSMQPAPPSQPTPVPTPLATVIAQLNDGDRVLTLDQEGKLAGVDDLPSGYQTLIKKALTTKQIERSSQLKGLSRPSSTLMGPNNQKAELTILEPIGNVLLTDRPTFRWTAMTGATSYLIEIYDDQFKLVTTSPQLTNIVWRATEPLSRGKVYAWQVKATRDGQEVTSPRPPAPQAKFRVLDQTRASELAKAKRTYASSHLTLGLLYAEAGLLNEAEQEFRALLKANPDSELAKSFIRQVQVQRRRRSG